MKAVVRFTQNNSIVNISGIVFDIEVPHIVYSSIKWTMGKLEKFDAPQLYEYWLCELQESEPTSSHLAIEYVALPIKRIGCHDDYLCWLDKK